MIWLQGGFCFCFWIGYGVIQSRRSHRIRDFVAGISRARRGLLGSVLFLVGAMVLVGGLGIVLQSGGFTRSGLTPAAWLVVTGLGLAFVHAQTMGTAMLVSLVQENVTNASESTSLNRAQGDRNQS